MSLSLVARSAVALSEHINSYFRVLRGSDPENVYLRLPTAGSFEVRHSVTNAPVVQVTDAGLSGVIQGGNIVDGTVGTAELTDGAVTSAKIADDSITNADVNSGANIAVTKLAHVGAGNVLKSTGTANVGGQIVNADVKSDAAITVSKLYGGGTASRIVRTTDGSTMVMGQLVSGDISGLAVAPAHITGGGTANTLLRTTDGTNTAFGKLSDNDVATGTIAAAKLGAGGTANRVVATADGSTVAMQQVVDAMVGSSAAIGLAKLAHVGAGNVLKSTGTANVGGQVVNADIAPGADIDGAKLLNGSITASKLGSGITAPATTLLATSGLMGAPQIAWSVGSISQAYTSLEIRYSGRSVAAVITESLRLTVNGVVTASYFNEYLYGGGASSGAIEGLAQSSADVGSVTGAAASAAQWVGAGTIWIHGYTSASLYKGAHGVAYTLWNTTTGTSQVQVKGATLGVAAPITSLTIGPATGNWAAGSIVSLYGVL